jgi:hypothetical protein
MKSETAGYKVVLRYFRKIMRKTIVHLFIAWSSVLVLGAADKTDHATTIRQRNQQLTEIRTPGSPSFRLLAKFAYQITAQKTVPVEGTYELLWSSPGEWKEEFRSGTSRVTRVFARGKISRLMEGVFPAPDADISGVFTVPPEPNGDHPSRVRTNSREGKPVSCVEMRYEPPDGPAPVYNNLERIECFDDTSGLLSQVQLQPSGKPSVWDFSDYAQWGNGKFVATTLKHQASSGEYYEVHVSKMAAETFDSSQFAVNDEGAPAKCKMQAPRILRGPEPNHSQLALHGRRDVRAVYRITVGSDGVPTSVAPQNSGGDLFDQESVWALMTWRFAPASCDGEPASTTIAVELNYTTHY